MWNNIQKIEITKFYYALTALKNGVEQYSDITQSVRLLKRANLTNSSMGLQMLSTSSKRPREDYLTGDAEDEGPAPAKMCKADDSLWGSDYYTAGKCYQCNDGNAFYGGGSPFACDHYGGSAPASPTHQCWPSAGSPASQQQSQQPQQQLATSPPHPSLSQPAQQPPHQPPQQLHLHSSHLPNHQGVGQAASLGPATNGHLCSTGTNVLATNTSSLASGNGHLAMSSSPLSAGTGSTYHQPIHHQAPSSPQQHQQNHYHHHHHHQHLQQQQQQQTIRCDENGKSYLDLGSGSCLVSNSPSNSHCGRSASHTPMAIASCPSAAALAGGPAAPNAAGTTTIATLNPRSPCNSKSARCGCGIDDYERRRINVLNLSMFKLGKYRAFPDPSLYRSVLICNTLRHIEREMELEGCFGGGPANGGQQSAAPPFFMLEPPPEPPRAPTPYPQTSGGGNSCAVAGACAGGSISLGSSTTSGSSSGSSSGAEEEDGDSGIGDDNRSINWGSVLSLSSQSDLDPLNNNDSLGELDFSQELDELIPSSCKLEDILLKSVPSAGSIHGLKESPEIDNIMQVLRFTTS